jgi:hypothetical protein
MDIDDAQLAALGKEKVGTPPPPPEAVEHPGSKCHKCGVSPICGIRYRCSVCYDFDYCESCEDLYYNVHPRQHYFLKIRHPLLLEPVQLVGEAGPITWDP